GRDRIPCQVRLVGEVAGGLDLHRDAVLAGGAQADGPIAARLADGFPAGEGRDRLGEDEADARIGQRLAGLGGGGRGGPLPTGRGQLTTGGEREQQGQPPHGTGPTGAVHDGGPLWRATGPGDASFVRACQRQSRTGYASGAGINGMIRPKKSWSFWPSMRRTSGLSAA